MALPNIYALTDTRWNNAGTTYNGIWLDVNNGAGGSAVGAAASRPFKLTNNGSAIFDIDLVGNTTITTPAGAIRFFNNGGNPAVLMGNTALNYHFGAASAITYEFAGASVDNINAFLTSDAANTLAQRNGTNAQTYYIYNTFTDSSNYEKGGFSWSGNRLFIQTLALGTGNNRDIFVQSSSGILQMSGTHLYWSNDNGNDIGASGSSRPRNIFNGGYHVLGVLTWGSISASVTPQEGLMIGCSSAATVAAGATVAASGTGHALLYYDGTQYKACN